MCVIAFSPKGNEAPTEKQIKEMFKKNPDGAGYAWDDGATVHFKKGFMNVDDLLEDLGPLEKWKDKNLAMHFRIGTAGKNDKKTTHPFPLTRNIPRRAGITIDVITEGKPLCAVCRRNDRP